MHHPTLGSITITAGLILALGCGGSDATDHGPLGGSVTVYTATSGPSPDTDGYSVLVDGAPRGTIGPNANLTLDDLVPGGHQVELDGIAPGCVLGGENPRPVQIRAGGTEEVQFAVTCGAATGSLKIVTNTTGQGSFASNYTVSLDGGAGRPIGVNASLNIPDLAAGDHLIGLSGLTSNCVLTGANPRTATVMPAGMVELKFEIAVTNGGVAQVTFQVSCFATGVGTLLFASDRTGTSHLYSMRQDGSRIVDLTPSMEVFDGDWSPDGSRIVFTTTIDEGLSIFVMNADGSNPVGLGVSGGGPRWSPDGRKILWSDSTIRVMNARRSGT